MGECIRTCHIVGAGELCKERLIVNSEDYVIGADGGYKYLLQLGISPDIVIGDYDSLGYIPSHANTVILPTCKDDTDMFCACRMAIEKGYNRIFIHGGYGGRLDHTLANIQLLIYLSKKGIQGYIIADTYTITSVSGIGSIPSISLDKSNNGMLSIFAFGGEAKGVNIRGLKYELNNACLYSDMAIGVSNEFVGDDAHISVDEGELVIYWDYVRDSILY